MHRRIQVFRQGKATGAVAEADSGGCPDEGHIKILVANVHQIYYCKAHNFNTLYLEYPFFLLKIPDQ